MNASVFAAAALMVLGAMVSAQDAAKCQSKSGQSYDVGSMFDDADAGAFYYCKAGGTAEAIGCINDGQRVYDLALFQQGDNVFRCRAQDTTVTHDLWGCAIKNADGSTDQKSIACTWDVGTDPINYVNTCLSKGGVAVVSQMYCLYTYHGGRIQINDGCYRIFPDDKVAAGCKRNADGTSLTLTTWPSSNAATDPSASGMSECPIASRR